MRADVAKVLERTDKRPDVVMLLGEIYGYLQMTRMAIHSAESRAFDTGSGAFFPHPDLAIVKTFMPMWMVRVNDIIDTLGAHNLLVTPSSSTFDDPRMCQLLERYMPGANGMSAQERSRIFRTAWDFSGSALGSRVELYERYYLASRQRALAGDHFTAQATEKWGQVRAFLEESGGANQAHRPLEHSEYPCNSHRSSTRGRCGRRSECSPPASRSSPRAKLLARRLA